jgi:hypothetical protein
LTGFKEDLLEEALEVAHSRGKEPLFLGLIMNNPNVTNRSEFPASYLTPSSYEIFRSFLSDWRLSSMVLYTIFL